jgi:hypothetical protein
MDGVKYTIQLVDKWGKPLDDLDRKLTRIGGKSINAPVDKFNKSLTDTDKKLGNLGKAGDKLKNSTSGVFESLNKIGIGPGMIGVGALTVGFYKLSSAALDSVKAFAQFEKYTVTLRTMLGSQGAARERMDEYTKIAASTPFQLGQVVEAGNQLQALGRYSKDTLIMLGDLAAASGKPIEQVISAYSKMASGQKGEAINMFRDLLISSNDWTAATGKGISKTGELLASTEELLSGLPKILKQKGFFGMMQAQSQTTEGKISNLDDSITQLRVNVGERLSGSYNKFLKISSGVVESMNKWVAIPSVEKIAKERMELNMLVKSITDTNTPQNVRLDLMQRIKTEYPEFLRGIDLEKASNEDLRLELEKVNEQYKKRMELAALSNIAREEEAKLLKLQEKQAKLSLVEKSLIDRDKLYSELVSKIKQLGITNNVTPAVIDQFGKTQLTAQVANPDNKQASANYQLYQNYKAAINSVDRYMDFFGIQTIAGVKEDMNKLTEPIDELTLIVQNLKNSIANKMALLQPKTTTTPTTPLSTSSTMSELEKQQATISGGGRNVKQINISINSLIGENNNFFKNGETVSDASEFLRNLSRALQMVVNDVNIN